MTVLFGYLAALVVIGALILFKGRDLFRPAISIVAFIIVFSVYTGYAGTDSQNLIIGALAGLVAALLSGFVLTLGVFVSGMIAGLGAAAQLIRWLPEDIAEHRILVTAVIAVIVGILAVKCLDPLVTVSTAAIGAALVGIPCTYMVMNLTDLTKNISMEPFDTMRNLNRAMFDDFMTQQTMIITTVTGILFIIGMVVQFRTNNTVRR